MPFYSCPNCTVASNRKYNIVRHIYRKHPGVYIPENMLPPTKNGKYSCPYCITSSNRKYNLKEHINRKHTGSKIPANLISANKNLTNSSLLSVISGRTFPHWVNFQNSIEDFPSTKLSRKQEDHNNSLFKTIFEFLSYYNVIQNERFLQKPYFYHTNNILNPSSINLYYEPLSNIDFGQPFLFKIYKCTHCFRDTPSMVYVFESIKTSSEYRCSFNCNLLPRITEENKNIIDPKIKQFSKNIIFSIIDNKADSKLYLKSIKISSYSHEWGQFDKTQFNILEKDNENNNENSLPSWLQKLLLYEEFVNVENTEKNNWACRLISSNDNKTEITREELIQFINLVNSTFGLFRLQKDHSIVHYFFIYLQLEKDPENF